MEHGSNWTPAGACHLTRRRVIRIMAAAAGLPLTIAAVRATAPPAQMFHWQGEVLDAVSELTLWHTDAPGALATCPICHLAHMPTLRGMPGAIVVTRITFARVFPADSQPGQTRTHARNSPPRAPPA